MQQFDPCRCAPCRHNGIPVLTGTSCKCICKSGYQGYACEETLRRGKPIKTSVRLKRTIDHSLKSWQTIPGIPQIQHPLNSMTPQIRRQTALGPAGAAGHPARRGEKPGREPALTPPQMVEEQPAWAPLHRPCTVRGTSPANLSLMSVEIINSPICGYCLAVCGDLKGALGFFSLSELRPTY